MEMMIFAMKDINRGENAKNVGNKVNYESKSIPWEMFTFNYYTLVILIPTIFYLKI